jgi:hypothetical protein
MTTCRLRGSCSAWSWEMLCAPSLVGRDVCREQRMDGVRHTLGLPERGDREPRTPTLADQRDRDAIGVLLVPFAGGRAPSSCQSWLRVCRVHRPQMQCRPWTGGTLMPAIAGWRCCGSPRLEPLDATRLEAERPNRRSHDLVLDALPRQVR